MGIDARILVRVPYEVDNEQIKRWSWHIAASLGADKFFLSPQQTEFGSPHGAFSKVDIWEQDGPDLCPKEGETFLEVNMWTRYYGPDYERGDILFICAVAEWCEQNIQGCEVWYGGDSSGVCVEPFPEEARRAMRRHLYTPDKGRAYFDEYSPITFPHECNVRPDTSACNLCIPNHRPQRYGYGQNYGAYHCRGCGKNFITRDNGATWTDKEC